jgi:hypothetical protein
LGRFISKDRLGYIDGANLFMAYFIPNMSDPLGDKCCCKLFLVLWYDPEVPNRQNIPNFLTNAKAEARRDAEYDAYKGECPKYKDKIDNVGAGFVNLIALFEKYKKQCKIDDPECEEKLSLYIVGHGMKDVGVRWPNKDVPSTPFDPNPPPREGVDEMGLGSTLKTYDLPKVFDGSGVQIDFYTCYSSITADQIRSATGAKTSGYSGITGQSERQESHAPLPEGITRSSPTPKP